MSNAIRMLICPEAEVDLYAFRRSREKGCVVRIIRGSRCSVLSRCMAEWGAAMQLPYCFEGTWTSLRRSLEELTWPANTTLVILVTMINRVMPRAPGELDQMLQTMVDFAKNRARRPGAPSGIELILHAEPRYAQDARQLLAATSVRLTPVER
jgi:hypothetical protein